MTLTSKPKRPYLVRAMHEWLTDNNFTPYLVVDVNADGLIAPTEYAQDGQLVLSVSYTATKDLYIDNDGLSFSARFGGVSKDLWIPMAGVLGIFAKENQAEGFFFDPTEYNGIKSSSPESQNNATSTKPKKGGLRVIK